MIKKADRPNPIKISIFSWDIFEVASFVLSSAGLGFVASFAESAGQESWTAVEDNDSASGRLGYSSVFSAEDWVPDALLIDSWYDEITFVCSLGLVDGIDIGPFSEQP